MKCTSLLETMACSMDRWIGQVAIVTGGSKGIGYAIVEQLLNAGVTVVAVARGKEKLEEISKNLQGRKGKILTYSADIAKEEDILNLFKWVKTTVGPVHILVNNANIYPLSTLTDGDSKIWKSIFDIQVMGLCIATREAVQDMRANKVDGHIVHINSISGHKICNFPNFHVMSASKFAITALTEILRNEFNLYKDKIKVSSISPGFVYTEGVEELLNTFKKNLTAEESDEWSKSPMLKPEDVANAVIYVLSTPPHVQIHELIIKPVGELL